MCLARLWVGSGFKSKDAVPKMVKDYLEKKLKLDEFISHTMTLDEINDAIDLMKQGKWYVRPRLT